MYANACLCISHDYKRNHFIIASTQHRYICVGEGNLGIFFLEVFRDFEISFFVSRVLRACIRSPQEEEEG